MSSLQMKYATIINKCKPSPANKKVFIQKLLSQTNKILFTSVKRMSGSISTSESGCVQGSMTVEAALLLPLFMFFFLHLAGVMEMLCLHGKLEAALWNAGNQIALYTDTFSETVKSLPDIGISYVVVHNQIKDFLGKDYMDDSPLVYGAEGLNYLRSEYFDDNECVDIVVTYQVEPPASIFPFAYRRMNNQYYAKAWTGYDVTARDEVSRYVYVTPQGEVWHVTPECSYIYHQVSSVPIGQIGSKKNEQGKYYKMCEFCEDLPQGVYVYFTKEGERYHFTRACSAIHKNIQAVEWYDELPYRPCSRCTAK